MTASLILPLLLIVLAVPMFLSARRQKRQMSEMQNLQKSLAPGDRIMTTSGMHATVASSDEDTIDLEIAPGVVTTWVRAAVREKLKDTDSSDSVVDTDLTDDDEDDTVTASAAEPTVTTESGASTESSAELAPPLEQTKNRN